MTTHPDKLLCLSVERATTPVAGETHCIVDAWWSVVPGQGILLFRMTPRSRWCTPQYNRNRLVTEKLTETLYPFAEVQQLPAVFLRLDYDNGFAIPREAVPYQPQGETMTDAAQILTGADWTNHVEQQVKEVFDHNQLVVNLSEEELGKIRAAIDEAGAPEGSEFIAKRGVKDDKGSFAMQLWVTLDDGGTHVAAFPSCLWDDRIEAATEAAIAVRNAYERATQ